MTDISNLQRALNQSAKNPKKQKPNRKMGKGYEF